MDGAGDGFCLAWHEHACTRTRVSIYSHFKNTSLTLNTLLSLSLLLCTRFPISTGIGIRHSWSDLSSYFILVYPYLRCNHFCLFCYLFNLCCAEWLQYHSLFMLATTSKFGLWRPGYVCALINLCHGIAMGAGPFMLVNWWCVVHGLA